MRKLASLIIAYRTAYCQSCRKAFYLKRFFCFLLEKSKKALTFYICCGNITYVTETRV